MTFDDLEHELIPPDSAARMLVIDGSSSVGWVHLTGDDTDEPTDPVPALVFTLQTRTGVSRYIMVDPYQTALFGLTISDYMQTVTTMLEQEER